MTEEWRPIKGYEGRYEVSSLGQVKTLNFKRSKNAKVLKGFAETDKRLAVTLYHGDGRKHISIHQLVAWTFLGKQPQGYEINHIDGNYLNNSLSNLEYVTRSQNLRHAFTIGLKSHKGAKNPVAIAAQRRRMAIEPEMRVNLFPG